MTEKIIDSNNPVLTFEGKQYNIPTFTTIPGAKAALKAIKSLSINEIKTISLQEIHN